jgi:DNA topoisomerase-1
MPLVIVESPAKCSKIKGFLGQGYDVIASMGHIRALEEDLGAIGLDRDFDHRTGPVGTEGVFHFHGFQNN